jgi:uncharacterized protein (TIGR03435 family)
MMQALLEERFRLRIHRETREVPVYALVVAKGGPKLPAFREGSCNPIDFTKFPPEVPENRCPSLAEPRGPNVVVNTQGRSIAEFCNFFLRRLDRPVIDRTGVTGRFNFHLVYASDDPNDIANATEPAGPPLFSALQQQLGLKLEPSRGPGEFLVIDRVERPSEN